MHATDRRDRIHLGVPLASRVAARLHQRVPARHRTVQPRPSRRRRRLVSAAGIRPSDAQLAEYRERVRAHIAEFAPPFEAREGRRAPEDAEQEALLRAWFAGLFDAG